MSTTVIKSEALKSDIKEFKKKNSKNPDLDYLAQFESKYGKILRVNLHNNNFHIHTMDSSNGNSQTKTIEVTNYRNSDTVQIFVRNSADLVMQRSRDPNYKNLMTPDALQQAANTKRNLEYRIK